MEDFNQLEATFSPEEYLKSIATPLRDQYRKHIQDHKFFLETTRKLDISESKAFQSWREYVETPTLIFINMYKLPQRLHCTQEVLFLNVTNVWDQLKKVIPASTPIYIDSAAMYYLYKHWDAHPIWNLYFKIKLRKIFKYMS
jgi:hypothetical protein